MITTLEFQTGQNSVRGMFKVDGIKLISFQEESEYLSINSAPMQKNKFMETMNLIVDATQPVKIKVLAANADLYPIRIEMHTFNGIKHYSIDARDGVLVWGQESTGNIAIDKGYKILEPGVSEYDAIYAALFQIFSETIPDLEKRRFIVSIILDNEVLLKQKKSFKAIQTNDGYCIIREMSN